MNPTEPIYDVAHLAHIELLTPKLEQSARFFIDVMGMTESCSKDDSVFCVAGMIMSITHCN
jgi:catechol 2,3-dioxygenase